MDFETTIKQSGSYEVMEEKPVMAEKDLGFLVSLNAMTTIMGIQKKVLIEQELKDEFWTGLGITIHKNNILRVIGRQIGALREILDDESDTARAIDRHDCWSEIASCAKKEGMNDFADILYFTDWLKQSNNMPRFFN